MERKIIVRNKLFLKKILINIGIFISFCMLSYLYIRPLLTTGNIYMGDDAWYQINRIIEVKRNIEVGNFLPYIYSYTFGQVAFPLGIFYPEITLIPISLISILFKHQVTGIYMGIALYTLLTLCIMYFVVRKLNRSRSAAYIATILYSLSIYRTTDAYSRFALGEYIAMTFLPLCFYGLYAVLKGKRRDGIYLVAGFSLILMTHVLSAIIVFVTMTLIWVISLVFIDEKLKRTFDLFVAGVASAISSLVFIGPFLEQELAQRYSKPSPEILTEAANNFNSVFLSSLDNSINKPYSLGIFSIIIILLGLIYFKKISNLAKVCLTLGISFFLFSTKLAPWGWLQSTPFSVIQFPFRLLMIPTLMFSIVGAELYDLLRNSYLLKKKSNSVFLVGMVMIIFSFWSSSVYQFKLANQSLIAFNNSSSVTKNPQYVDQYTPKKTQKYLDDIEKHIAIVNDEYVKIKDIKSIPGEIILNSKSFKKGVAVDIPVAFYKNYVVKQGGKNLDINKSKRNTIEVKLINDGSITVGYQRSLWDWISYIVSIIMWVAIVIYMVKINLRWDNKKLLESYDYSH